MTDERKFLEEVGIYRYAEYTAEELDDAAASLRQDALACSYNRICERLEEIIDRSTAALAAIRVEIAGQEVTQ